MVVCDEAHQIQNEKSRRTRSIRQIKTRRRIALTGTPLQNNLIECKCRYSVLIYDLLLIELFSIDYHMVEFVKPSLLGTKKEFKINFEYPIQNGQYHDSTSEDIRLMKKRTHVLHKILCKTVQVSGIFSYIFSKE